MFVAVAAAVTVDCGVLKGPIHPKWPHTP